MKPDLSSVCISSCLREMLGSRSDEIVFSCGTGISSGRCMPVGFKLPY